MSDFPNPNQFSQKNSTQHLVQINHAQSEFIFKKQKDVYTYDLDNQKYIDFSLQGGEIFAKHSPSRLGKFLKNALSIGFGHNNAYNKFLYKATKLWKTNLNADKITFFDHELSAFLTILNSFHKKNPIIGTNSKYIFKKLLSLSNLVEIIDITETSKDVDILFYEEIPDQDFSIQISYTKKILIQSRFLLRNKIETQDEILILNFEGFSSAISTGDYPTPFLSPMHGIFFLEGGKYFCTLKEFSEKSFKHNLVNSFNYYAIPKIELDPKFFLKRGILVEKDIIYFSPHHSTYDFKRLRVTLDEFEKITKQ